MLQKIYSFNCRNKRLQCYDYGKNNFDPELKNDIRTYDNVKKKCDCSRG